MNPVKVMINGLPGNVAGNIATQILADHRFRLLPWSLTGPDIAEATCAVDTFSIQLLTPEKRDAEIERSNRRKGTLSL